jgi:hypothetical protein
LVSNWALEQADKEKLVIAPLKEHMDKVHVEFEHQWNEDGKCCFHHCDNLLPEEKYDYMGFLTCEKCGKRLRAEMKEWQDELLLNSIQNVMLVLRPNDKDE